MSKKVYSARKFLSVSTEELRSLLQGTFTVLFEDGVKVEMTAHEVCISSFFWDIHRDLKWLPITSDQTIKAIIGSGRLNSSTHIKLFERIFWAVMDKAEERGKPLGYEDIDKLNEFIYRKSNAIYNYVCTDLERFTISVDSEDYIEIVNLPEFKQLMDEFVETDEGILEAYSKATAIILNDPRLSENDIAIAARSSVIKLNQLLQVIVFRGNVTDIDSMIFPQASAGNFINGFRDWYSFFIDTRTAAKSLFFSGKLLRDSEYNSRKLQFLCQSVETIYPVDCGSTKFLSVLIKPDSKNEEGKVVKKGDFERYLGKYFEDPETKAIREFTPKDGKYIGSVLKFRSMIAGCQHPDPHGVCGVCFNSVHRVIPPGTNIGWMVVAALMQILNQSILAVKHVDSSSSSNNIVLDSHHSKYLTVNSEGNGYKFHPSLKGQNITLEVSIDQLPAASSILTIEDHNNVAPSHLSELTQVFLNIGDITGYDYSQEVLILTYEKRNPFLTLEALKWIKQKGYTQNEKGNIFLDFTGWPLSETFAQLPARHFNNADHAKDITDLIQGKATNVSDRKKRKQDGSVVDYFHDLYDLVTSRLENVPASIIELIVYGASIRSSADGDYRLPKANTTKEMGLSASTVPFRSMGAAVGYEYVTREIFTNTSGYDPAKTSSHIADVFVTPSAAIEDSERRYKKFGRVSEQDFAEP